MRYTLFFICTLMLGVSYAQTPHEIICKDHHHIVEMETSRHEAIANFRTNPLTNDYDVKYHRLEWEVDPAQNFIKGTITTYFEPMAMNFQTINFDMSTALVVNEIKYHGEAITAYSLGGDDNLEINLPMVIAEGTLDSISVSYEGVPASTGFGSFEASTHNGTPVMWTLSEPYGAKGWWPCKQSLNDKIDSIDIMVTTPEAYRVASNGLLIGEYATGEGDKLYHWKHGYPIPAYLIAIAATDYAVFSDYVTMPSGDSLEILNYVYPENLAAAEAGTGLSNTVAMIELFNELFGDYPFAEEKYGHAEFGWGGGMEHQTMSFMGSYDYGLQAHELAHQWFGNKITCGSWEDIWLNEGFATYLTGLTYERLLQNQDYWTQWKRGAINYVTSQPGGSVFVTDTTVVGNIFNGRLSYNKGALLLHMLRWKLGDEDFFGAVYNYINDPALAYNYARTYQLIDHLESESGQDLTEFFADWFYGEGYPSYQVNWQPILEDTTDYGIAFTLSQTTSASVDFFEMPVPIKVLGQQGQDTILVLNHESQDQFFRMNLPFAPRSVEFDPELWIISKDNTVAESSEIVSVRDLELLKGINLTPNPASDFLDIQIDESITKLPNQITITDVAGREVVSILAPQFNQRLDVSSWAKGVYLVNVRYQEKWLSKKVVKQ